MHHSTPTKKPQSWWKICFVLGAVMGTALVVIAGVVHHWAQAPRGKGPEAASDPTITDWFYSEIGAYQPPPASRLGAGAAPQGVGGARYAVELGIARDQSTAEERIEWLSNQGVTAYYTPLQDGPTVVYRVRSGVFASRAEAEAAADGLRNLQTQPGSELMEPRAVQL